METAPPARSSDAPLSARLREATRAAHTAAENAPFMARLLRGELGREDYAELLWNLRPIYVALERELASGAASGRLAGLRLAGLARQAALTRDLLALGRVPTPEGPAGPTPPRPGAERLDRAGGGDRTAAADRTLRPATRAYVARLASLNGAAPVRLAAHAYVRYLGDLAGGQILRRIVATKLGAPVAFYDFGGAEPARALARSFRAALDGLALAPAEAGEVVDEALWAFEQHTRLFDELDARSTAADAARA